MVRIELGGKRGRGRFIQVSDHRIALLPTLEWRVKRFPSGYEQIIRAGIGGWRFPLSRVIMEQILGRPLTSQEHVHHKDEDTFNNTDENLGLMSKGAHVAEHNRRSRSHERAEKAATAARRSNPDCGVYLHRGGRWQAYYLGGYLGAFATKDEAIGIYRAAVASGPGYIEERRQALRARARGVHQLPNGRWWARFLGKSRGMYATEEEANAAYFRAREEHEATRS